MPNSAGAQRRRRRLTRALAVFALHIPAVTIGMAGTTTAYVIPFAVVFVPAAIAWVIFFDDILRNHQVARGPWAVAAIALPQLIAVYWWLHVRPDASQEP